MIVLHIHPRRGHGEPETALADLEAILHRRGTVAGRAMEFASRGTGEHARLVGTLDSGVEALGLMFSLIRRGSWDVVVDVGGTGERERGRGLERARRSAGRCAVVGADAATQGWIEPALQLLGAFESRRSEPQQEAGRLVETGASQREVAAELGVSQQAVHARLRGGLWHETRALAGAVAAALEHGVSDSWCSSPGMQRLVECGQEDSSLVIEQLRAQGWESDEVETRGGRTAIRVHRPDLTGGEDVRGALEESGFAVTEE